MKKGIEFVDTTFVIYGKLCRKWRQQRYCRPEVSVRIIRRQRRTPRGNITASLDSQDRNGGIKTATPRSLTAEEQIKTARSLRKKHTHTPAEY
jgi:hypothetical protein